MQTNIEWMYEQKVYQQSRRAYALECTFEYFVAILVSDSFLAKLLTSLNFTDAQAGLVSSLISLAFLFQLLAVPVVQRITSVKRFSALFHGISQMLFTGLFLIPFLGIDPAKRRVIAVVCILLAYMGNYLVTSTIYQWGNSFVAPRKRALFSANKEMLSLVSGIVVSLGFGFVADSMEAAGDLNGSFLFIAAGIFVFSLCDLICLLLIRKETAPVERIKPEPFMAVIRSLMGNRAFLLITLQRILWDVGKFISIGFMGTFKINDLMFTLGQLQLISIGGSMARFLLSRPFGRFSDRHSYAVGAEVGLIVAIGAFIATACTSPATRWLIIVHTILYSVCQAGINSNMINMTYHYVDKKYFVQANALKNSISGLCGFGASLLGGRILSAVQANDNTVFGIPMYGQQFLSILSIVILLGAVLLTRFTIRKLSIDTEGGIS